MQAISVLEVYIQRQGSVQLEAFSEAECVADEEDADDQEALEN